MKKILKKENTKWFLIIFFVVLTSLPSMIRIYKIQELYFSKDVQSMAVQSNVFVRQEYGLGATDSKLKDIILKGDKTIFHFSYSYKRPNDFFKEERKSYQIEFDDNKNIEVKGL